jgi:uncharacterized protein (TIGR02646 family)
MENARNDWSWVNNKAGKTNWVKTGKNGKPKHKKGRGRNAKKRAKVSMLDNKNFYTSTHWQELRVRVLENNKCCCMMCGASPKEDGIKLHVDHIKPRSKYPELSLDYNNLQVLCEPCNLGKGNRYETDYRPDSAKLTRDERIEADLDMEILFANDLS